MANLARRGWSFLFIGVSPLIGYFFYGKSFPKRKTIQSLGIIVILCLTLASMDAIKPYFDYNFKEKAELLLDMRGYEEWVYASVSWYTLYSNDGSSAVGDPTISTRYGTILNCDIYSYRNLYADISQIELNLEILKRRGIKYIFVNHLMAAYKGGITYGAYVEKIPENNLIELAQLRNVNRIYDNGIIQILEFY